MIELCPDKHNYWRTPSGEIVCDCEYYKLCVEEAKKALNHKNDELPPQHRA